MLISRLPPPRSAMQRGGVSGPSAAMAASLPSRDSSAPLITSSAIPAFCLMCRTKASRLRASRGAGGHGAITRHAEFVHHLLEMAKCFDAFLEDIFSKTMAQEHAFPEA